MVQYIPAIIFISVIPIFGISAVVATNMVRCLNIDSTKRPSYMLVGILLAVSVVPLWIVKHPIITIIIMIIAWDGLWSYGWYRAGMREHEAHKIDDKEN